MSELVTKFRTALENMNSVNFTGTSLSVSKFPNACCDDASLLLASYLADNGYPNINLIRGSDGGKDGEFRSHVWLKLDDINIDITADQFNGNSYRNQLVIIESSNSYLKTFDTVMVAKVTLDLSFFSIMMQV
ncbi:hypothetical protein [Photobacterium carnosum]|uniref:hypothetical protein n=1 Tax=Photobacterium carnosum TaxID=2023717 RepID=UPI001E506641|nr:hypothetical protein [Photobacterium carnosum]MCD9530070.1 hypothetical protein [Photobacterium carnosum]MCF2152926.1 hypothetical protein [Photobacterium carnosum]MCF2214686.1 hypothetical protein [Photobacterium carnosum]